MTETVEILESVTFDYGMIELRSDNILTYEPRSEITNFTIPQIKKISEIFLKLTNGKPALCFCNISHYKKNSTPETKVFMKSQLHLFATALAITENSTYIAYLAHIFLYLYKPKVPVKLFKSKEKAIDWLKSLDKK